MMARALPLLALLLADAALAQDCSTTEMMNVQDIVATCCESAVNGGNCGTMFPATCSHSCARLVVPYIDSCGTILRVMPDEAFPGLHIAGYAITIASLYRHVRRRQQPGSPTCSSQSHGASFTLPESNLF